MEKLDATVDHAARHVGVLSHHAHGSTSDTSYRLQADHPGWGFGRSILVDVPCIKRKLRRATHATPSQVDWDWNRTSRFDLLLVRPARCRTMIIGCSALRGGLRPCTPNRGRGMARDSPTPVM